MQRYKHVPPQWLHGESCCITLKLFHLTSDPMTQPHNLWHYWAIQGGLKLQAGWEMSLAWVYFSLLSNSVSLTLKSFTCQAELK